MKNKSLLLATLMTLFLAACGPLYETQYTFHPLHTNSFKKCHLQCRENHLICQNSCNASSSACMAEANTDRIVYGFGNYARCSSYCGCDKLYRACFRLCGGHITARTVCADNCKKMNTTDARPKG